MVESFEHYAIAYADAVKMQIIHCAGTSIYWHSSVCVYALENWWFYAYFTNQHWTFWIMIERSIFYAFKSQSFCTSIFSISIDFLWTNSYSFIYNMEKKAATDFSDYHLPLDMQHKCTKKSQFASKSMASKTN